MRYLWIGGLLVTLGTVVLLRAQIFNLEDEDKLAVTPTAAAKSTRVPGATIKVPAGELPDVDAQATEKLDKLYGEIVTALKANKVDVATKLISKHDVITKQKVIYRLLQENPRDFRLPSSADDEAASSTVAVPPAGVEEPAVATPTNTQEEP